MFIRSKFGLLLIPYSYLKSRKKKQISQETKDNINKVKYDIQTHKPNNQEFVRLKQNIVKSQQGLSKAQARIQNQRQIQKSIKRHTS